MKCDCGKQLKLGSIITGLGNEIEYSECKDCGVVEVMGIDVKEAESLNG